MTQRIMQESSHELDGRSKKLAHDRESSAAASPNTPAHTSLLLLLLLLHRLLALLLGR